MAMKPSFTTAIEYRPMDETTTGTTTVSSTGWSWVPSTTMTSGTYDPLYSTTPIKVFLTGSAREESVADHKTLDAIARAIVQERYPDAKL